MEMTQITTRVDLCHLYIAWPWFLMWFITTPVATLATKSCTSLSDYPLPMLYAFSHSAALALAANSVLFFSR